MSILQISLCNNRTSLFMFFDVMLQSSNSKSINHIKFGKPSPSISSSQMSGIQSPSISHLNWFNVPFNLAFIHTSFFVTAMVDVLSKDIFQFKKTVFFGKYIHSLIYLCSKIWCPLNQFVCLLLFKSQYLFVIKAISGKTQILFKLNSIVSKIGNINLLTLVLIAYVFSINSSLIFMVIKFCNFFQFFNKMVCTITWVPAFL